ncbi:hypothetical protein JCM11251_004979 [Rhodosporidiobolus azoricus]
MASFLASVTSKILPQNPAPALPRYRASLSPTWTSFASCRSKGHESGVLTGCSENSVTAEEAQNIDKELMGEEGAFSLDQLMELAGLSVAQAVASLYPLGPELPHDANGIKQKRDDERVLVCCGPGNQGGDGLVAARHLYHFGYAPSIFYPKESKGEIFARLKKQCENLDLPFIAPPPSSTPSSLSSFPMSPSAQTTAFTRALSQTDIVLDCVFGFSFKGPPREPFKEVLKGFKGTGKKVLSVDVPSGWDVEEGNPGDGFTPDSLISLTAPKLGVKALVESGQCRHLLGGRFIPDSLAARYRLNLPKYPADGSQIVDISIRKE